MTHDENFIHIHNLKELMAPFRLLVSEQLILVGFISFSYLVPSDSVTVLVASVFVFSSLSGMLVHCRVTPSSKFTGTH